MDLNKSNSKGKEIVFGPGDKLRFLEQVAFDPNASDFDARVCIALANRIDKYTGRAICSQATLAKLSSGSQRGVGKSTHRLERLGHLSVTRTGGRFAQGGKRLANVYQPIVKERRSLTEAETQGTPFPIHKEHGDTSQGTVFTPYLILT